MKILTLIFVLAGCAFAQVGTLGPPNDPATFSTTVNAPIRIVDASLDDWLRISGRTFKIADLILAVAASPPQQSTPAPQPVAASMQSLSRPAVDVPLPPPVIAPRTASVTISHQPLAIFTIALGSKLKAIAGYSSRTCETSLTAPLTISGGRISQWIEQSGLPVIPVQLAAAAATEARVKSKAYRLAQYTSEASYYLALLMGANIIRVGMTGVNGTIAQRAARIAPIVIGHQAEAAKDALAVSLPDPIERFKGQVLTDQEFTLQPGQCQTLLFMGEYVPTFKTLTGTVEGHL